MKRVSLTSADKLKRLLFQEGRVTSLHATALVAVALSYLANHPGPFPVAACAKSCGLPGVFTSLAAWWPIAVSWWVVKHPGETSVSFRWWQVLFALINLGAAVGYFKVSVLTLAIEYTAFWSILHIGALMAIAPLAVESEATFTGE